MTKTLVVYYSRTNHTHKIGELIAQGVGANIERVVDAQSREGALGYWRSGREAMFQRAGRIQPVKEDPFRYDLTVIGSPVWSWSLSPPMRSYAITQKHRFKQVAFFCDSFFVLSFEFVQIIVIPGNGTIFFTTVLWY